MVRGGVDRAVMVGAVVARSIVAGSIVAGSVVAGSVVAGRLGLVVGAAGAGGWGP